MRAQADLTANGVAAVAQAIGAVLHGRAWSLGAQASPDEFLTAAIRHRASTLIAHRVDLPPDLDHRIAAEDRTQRLNALRQTQELMRVLVLLEGAGVRALAFKGPALSALVWDDFARRGFGDLDILVAPGDVERAWRALVADGWQHSPTTPEPGPGWAWRHVMRTYYELSLVGPVVNIDLHWYPTPHSIGFPPFDALWRSRATVDVAGHLLPTLSRFESLAHSASHAAKDDWAYLRSLADVHVLAADRRTWIGSNRSLNSAQLSSIGIAFHAFGAPRHPPDVTPRAVKLARRTWPRVQVRQRSKAIHDTVGQFPGEGALHGFGFALRGNSDPRNVVAALSRLVAAPADLHDVQAAGVWSAVGPVIARNWRRLGRSLRNWQAGRR